MNALLPTLGAFACLFDEATNFRCVVKDRQHRYLYVSKGWLESQLLASASEVLGKTALDLFPPWRAERYMLEEREVMEQRKQLDYLEYSVTATGRKERWRSLKGPWIHEGEVVGYTNLSMLVEPRALKDNRGDVMPYVMDWMTKHATETISIGEIAEQCNMSCRSLERYFVEKSGDSPSHYRTRCRVKRAKALLQETEESLTAIATACGFYDQSHMSRVFSKEVGMTPGKWRESGRM